MSKLMDICCLVDYNKKLRKHNKEKSVFGSILIDEQSDYFEGFVRTYDEKNTYIVFGTFNEDGFQMHACNEKMNEPQDKVKYAIMNKKYKSNSNALRYAEYTSDDTIIIIQDGEIFRDVELSEISLLQTKIDTIKKQCNLVVENKQKILK